MKIAILGGGISGLSAAWYARKKYPKATISLYEKSDRVGGWIQTRTRGPFLFELGPRTFQTGRCKELLRLIADVGLKDKIIHSDPAANKRYLLHNGHLASVFPSALLAIAKDLIAKKGSGADESIESFATRRFGRRAAWQFFDPMALGVYAGDIRRLSVKSCFPFLVQWEQKYRSIALAALRQKKNQSGLFTLSGGMQQLCEALGARSGVELHLNSPVDRFPDADLILCALPADAAARLFNLPTPVRMESLEVVNLGFHGEVLGQRGFGYLVPTKEKEKLLGMIWDSSIFPTPGQTKITAMIKSAHPVEDAIEALRRHCGVGEKPDAVCHTRAEVPQYEVGHEGRVRDFVERARERFPKGRLLGNYLHGASVNACIKQAGEIFGDD